MYARTCCYLMMNFNLMKFFYFPIFHVHKNSKLNLFRSISRNSNFRVLHTTSQGPPTLWSPFTFQHVGASHTRQPKFYHLHRHEVFPTLSPNFFIIVQTHTNDNIRCVWYTFMRRDHCSVDTIFAHVTSLNRPFRQVRKVQEMAFRQI